VCKDIPENQCKTTYTKSCGKHVEKKCAMEYENQCQQTVEQKCRVVQVKIGPAFWTFVFSCMHEYDMTVTTKTLDKMLL